MKPVESVDTSLVGKVLDELPVGGSLVTIHTKEGMRWGVGDAVWTRTFMAALRGNYQTERLAVLQWLVKEWSYSDKKFPPEVRERSDERMAARPDFSAGPEGAWWRTMIDQYLHRASVLGLDTPLGRQALMKALNTLFPACESMVRVYGMPPAPGVNSGEAEEWAP